jgi:hypothetical protein
LISFAFISADEVLDMKIENMKSMHELTRHIFHMLETNWESYKCVIARTLYPFSVELYNMLENIKKSKDEFYGTLIEIYTMEYVYKQVNKAMRRAAAGKAPTGDDILLSLYSLCLQAVIVHWDKLKSFQSNCYRGLDLKDDEFDYYKEGAKCYWFSFTSTSQKKEIIEAYGDTKFIIKNEWKIKKLHPKQIEEYSKTKEDFEVLYPAGVKFKIQSIEKDRKKIHLVLLDEVMQLFHFNFEFIYGICYTLNICKHI